MSSGGGRQTGPNAGEQTRGVKDIPHYSWGVFTYIQFLDLFKVIFVLSTMANHH